MRELQPFLCAQNPSTRPGGDSREAQQAHVRRDASDARRGRSRLCARGPGAPGIAEISISTHLSHLYEKTAADRSGLPIWLSIFHSEDSRTVNPIL
jgi:hypothetical protein